MSINKQIILTTLILIVNVIFFGISDIDLTVQDYFFNTKTHMWIMNSYMQPYEMIFYTGAKRSLIVFALLLLFLSIIYRKTHLIKIYKKGIIVILLSAIFVPSITGLLKDHTNMPCPKNEIRYGGLYPRTAVWECYPRDFKLPQTKCWPAGHASGGFALLSLFFLFKKRRNRLIALGISLSIAWSMGLYKMLIGDHFLSHTLITMFLAWLIILFLQKIVNFYFKEPPLAIS
jgi:membrane-associated PAP2 superfamily phosphatase